MCNYSVSQIFCKYFFPKKKMWGNLKLQGVAIQLPLRPELGEVAIFGDSSGLMLLSYEDDVIFSSSSVLRKAWN
jgi:hypothetical protein